tara:strand:- start:1071 stop:1571 length:501 start_codon:yes stop_codon:yes gene_type:complete
MSKELRNQLKSQNLDTVLPTAFKQVGGAVFPDITAKADLKDFEQIINSYRGVHSPTFGVPIPVSGFTNVQAANFNIEPLTDTQVGMLQGISCYNQGPTDALVSLMIDGCVVASLTVPSGPSPPAGIPIILQHPVYWVANQILSVFVDTLGNPNDIQTTYARVLVVQ